METKVVFEGTTDKGLTVIIRYPTLEDASTMCKYINELSSEQTYIALQGKQFTQEEEVQVIKDTLENIQKKHAIQLLAFAENTLIGIADIHMQTKEAMQHEGVFGVSVQSAYRGKGIGKLLMQMVIDEALKNIPQLQILTLGIFGNNGIACSLYEKLGFTKFGTLPEGILHKGQYIDHVYMYKKVR